VNYLHPHEAQMLHGLHYNIRPVIL
jgi:hypothetical protein